MSTGADVLKLIEEKGIKYVDLRFTDTKGKEQHVTVPTRMVDDAFFEDGKGFDGSSIAGWKGIQESDMILMPDASTAIVDPFFEEPTLNLRCDIVEPSTMQGYERDPRSLAKRAEAYLKSTGIADASIWGPENEFFIFDNVRHGSSMNGCFYEVDSAQGAWNSGAQLEGGNLGHRPTVKGGYFPVPPVDTYQDLRTAMCGAMEQLGLKVEVHHAEVATGGQAEINVSANTLVKKADEVQILKYAIHNVAAAYGKTATFMPKPLVGDNGNGMHVNQSLAKDGKNIFAGDKYGGLSEIAIYYIGGIIKHAKALNAISQRQHQQLQAPGAGLRSARDARVLRAQPLGVDPHPARHQPEGPPHRSALPGQHREPVPLLRGDADGRPRRREEQDSPGRPGGQGPLRPRARGSEGHPDRLPFARHGPRSPRQGPRLPQGRRRVHGRRHRRLHQPEDAGSHAAAHVDAPGGARALLQRLTRAGSAGIPPGGPSGRPARPPSMTHFADRGSRFVSGIASRYASGP